MPSGHEEQESNIRRYLQIRISEVARPLSTTTPIGRAVTFPGAGKRPVALETYNMFSF